MTHTEERQIYQAAIEKFGVSHQMEKLTEELIELSDALIKYKKHGTYECRIQVLKELVDVDIVSGQIKQSLYGNDLDFFNEYKQQKLERLKELIKL